MNKYLNGLVAVVICCCAGCTATLTNRQPYREYANKDLKLKRSIILCERKLSNVTLWHGEISLKRGELFDVLDTSLLAQIKEEDSPRYCYEKYPQSIGTSLKIRNFYSSVTDLGVRAVGEIYLKELDQNVPFEYTWPQDDKGNLLRAPWEDDTVFAQRTVAYMGK